MNLKEKIRVCLDRADESLQASELSMQSELAISTVNRAYYAVFYSLSALLLSKNVTAKTHSGVISLFGKHFIHSGHFDREISYKIAKIFEFRNEADYDLECYISEDELKEAMDIAHDIVKLSKEYLGDVL